MSGVQGKRSEEQRLIYGQSENTDILSSISVKAEVKAELGKKQIMLYKYTQRQPEMYKVLF